MKLSNRGNGLGYILFFSLSCLLIQININAAQQLQSPKVILRLSDGTGLPLKKREIDRMGMIKAHVEMQETNEPLEVPVADDFVTPEAGTLLMHLMENVLGDTDYETNPEQINNNKNIAQKHLNWLTNKNRLAGNAHRFNLLKDLYGAADYLNVQLLKTSEQSDANPQAGDHALQKLIAYETTNSLLAGEYTIDLNVSHRNLNEDLKLELA
ncbi:hypothetical protein EBU24_03990, partial [bacterium]|nr:hypothetical protein [bacterium]